MKNISFLQNKYILRLLIPLAGIVSVYLGFRLFGNSNSDMIALLHHILSPYLSLTEIVANPIIAIFTDGVELSGHKMQFTAYLPYYEENKELIDNWISNLLYLKWIAFLLIIFWISSSTLKKKLIYTSLLIPLHFVAVVLGLIMLGAIGPLIVDPNSLSELKPHFVGALGFFGFFVFWFKKSKNELWMTFQNLGLKIDLTNQKINEILLIFLGFLLLKNFIVPYFNFYSYIDFLLGLTKFVASSFGFNPHINGPYIIGDNGGQLFMAKWCLGLVTIYLFSSIVFLTRVSWKPTLIYIISGIVFLHILNIIRLTLLFMYVQHFSTEMAMDHHDIYNNIIYVIIFIMWVIWFERFYLRTQKKSKPGSTPSKT